MGGKKGYNAGLLTDAGPATAASHPVATRSLPFGDNTSSQVTPVRTF